MVGVLATFRGGRVELSVPVGWADGTPLEVVPLHSADESTAGTDHRHRVAQEIATFAESYAGSELDLDWDLELAAHQTLSEDE